MCGLFNNSHLDLAFFACFDFKSAVLFVFRQFVIIRHLGTAHTSELALELKLLQNVLDGSMNLLVLGSFASHGAITVMSRPLINTQFTKWSVAL